VRRGSCSDPALGTVDVVSWLGRGVRGLGAIYRTWIARADEPGAEIALLDLLALDVAVDLATARRMRGKVEEALAAAGHPAETVATVARAVCDVRPRWTHVALRSWPMGTPGEIAERFRTTIEDNRARARISVVPTPRDHGPGYRGGPTSRHEDDAHVLLSMTVVSRIALEEPRGTTPPEHALSLLRALASLPPVNGIDDLHVAWLPEHPDDAHRSDELLARHPDLVRVSR
jgi:hypothetical protein